MREEKRERERDRERERERERDRGREKAILTQKSFNIFHYFIIIIFFV